MSILKNIVIDLKKELTEYFTEEMKEECLKETKALS